MGSEDEEMSSRDQNDDGSFEGVVPKEWQIPAKIVGSQASTA